MVEKLEQDLNSGLWDKVLLELHDTEQITNFVQLRVNDALKEHGLAAMFKVGPAFSKNLKAIQEAADAKLAEEEAKKETSSRHRKGGSQRGKEVRGGRKEVRPKVHKKQFPALYVECKEALQHAFSETRMILPTDILVVDAASAGREWTADKVEHDIVRVLVQKPTTGKKSW